MNKLTLNGKWQIKNCTSQRVITGDVPGSDFGNLIKYGEIVNPLISGAEAEALKTAENDFEFSRSFTLTKDELEYENIHLVCSCLDTLCICYINGTKAFECNNAFIPVDEDIKQYLREGENEIVIHFNSAYKYITAKQKEKAMPKNSNGVDGIPYIRKSGCHFGWDWGPCVPYNYIGDIELVCYNRRIENITITQQTSKEKSVVTAKADNADRCYIITPDGKEIYSENVSFEIENPELWYIREMNGKEKQALYTVVFENEEERVEKKIGLRSLYLDMNKDEYGDNFCFILNGEKVFAKGANLIPFSAIPEDCNEDTVDYYLDLAQKANFNMLRVWGGGSYADDSLLSKCDERGILIWQDFMFACQMYPHYDKEFTENVMREVDANVRRMTIHPSLALLCGNNEIEVMFSYIPETTQLRKSYVEFFYNTLPEALRDLTDVSYIPSSPIGSAPFKDCGSDNVGDTHMWNVWHGLKKLDYYQNRYTRFLSEFGLESLPSMKAIDTFATPDDYYITSEAFNRHQKCIGGNRKMEFYLTEMFDFPEKFRYLPYLTGIVQAECIKNAAVHFRQNKGRCNGALFWQFNDVWNCPSWSSVDFEGVPKALQYKAEYFFDPVTLTCKKEKGKAILFVHNDTLSSVDFKVELAWYNLSGEKLRSKEYATLMRPNSFFELDSFDYKKDTVLKVSYDGKSYMEVFDKPSNLKLKKAKLDYTVDGNKVTIKSDTFAYNVCIESDAIPEENYFSMVKGEEKTVVFNKPVKDITVYCANNIEFRKNALKKEFFRFTYRLEPLNIGNFVYYSSKA